MLLCPTCGKPIPPADVNIAADTAICRSCNTVTAVSSVMHKERAQTVTAVDPARPPPGAYFHDNGVEIVIGATTRSPLALFLVPFLLVWSGGSLGGIYGSQIAKGKFDPGMCLFGIPFLLGTIALGSFAAMTVFGRAEVRLRQGEGTVFIGVGPIGWKRRFNAADIRTIREDVGGWRSGGQPRRAIVLEGATRLVFGSLLSEARRYFVLEVLRRSLKVS